MNKILIIFTIGFIILSCSDKVSEVPKVRLLLVQQLKNTHTNQEWFVPTNRAIEGLTLEQSNWKDSTENHSIGELVSHLVYWNEINLRAFKGEDMTDFEVDNETTFKMYIENEWVSLVSKLDSIQTEWESTIEKASEKQITDWSSEIANMSSHTAYHTGQIMYIRKQKGWWK